MIVTLPATPARSALRRASAARSRSYSMPTAVAPNCLRRGDGHPAVPGAEIVDDVARSWSSPSAASARPSRPAWAATSRPCRAGAAAAGRGRRRIAENPARASGAARAAASSDQQRGSDASAHRARARSGARLRRERTRRRRTRQAPRTASISAGARGAQHRVDEVVELAREVGVGHRPLEAADRVRARTCAAGGRPCR